MRSAFDIIGRNLFDEFWNIDSGGAAFGARRIITKNAAVSFHQGSLFIFKRGVDIAEVLCVLRFVKPVVCY